jgi:hypothetical protein
MALLLPPPAPNAQLKLDANFGTPDVYILEREKPQREKEGKRL